LNTIVSLFAQFRPAAVAELFPCVEELDLTDVARQVILVLRLHLDEVLFQKQPKRPILESE